MRADGSTFQTGSSTLITLRSNILLWLRVSCFTPQDYIRSSTKLFTMVWYCFFNYKHIKIIYSSKKLLPIFNKYLTPLSISLLNSTNPGMKNINKVFLLMSIPSRKRGQTISDISIISQGEMSWLKIKTAKEIRRKSRVTLDRMVRKCLSVKAEKLKTSH